MYQEPRNMTVTCKCGTEITTAADGVDGAPKCCNCGVPLIIPNAEILNFPTKETT